MKITLTLFALIFTVHGFSQTLENPEGFKLSNLSVGVSTSFVLDNLEYPLFREVISYSTSYIVDVEDKSHSSFYQANVEYRTPSKFYASAAIGLGIDNIDSDILYTSSWADVGAGGSSSSNTTRNISINEKRMSVVGSFETGFYFLKSERRFQFGIGMGADLMGYFKPKVINNEIIKTSTSTTFIDYPGNPTYTTTTATSTHDDQSEEWNYYVKPNSWSFISPKIIFTASVKVQKHISIFGKAQIRFLLLSADSPAYRSTTQFPISGGIQYHF